LVSGLQIASETIIVALVTAMIVGGVSSAWNARKPDEYENRRKEDIWKAIKQWIELPIIQFREQKDTLPLCEKPPELADAVEKCLSRKYSSIWIDLQKLRDEYHAWKNEDVPAKFIRHKDGDRSVNIDAIKGYNDSMRIKLMSLHSRLVERIKSEIIDKHFTQLKC
jgi:hypothetical protein